jgi:hypothetical protein
VKVFCKFSYQRNIIESILGTTLTLLSSHVLTVIALALLDARKILVLKWILPAFAEEQVD